LKISFRFARFPPVASKNKLHAIFNPVNGFVEIPAPPLRSLGLDDAFTINRGWKPIPRKTRALSCHFLRTRVDLIPGRPAPRL
jgi:hypothetical protein